MQPGDRPALLAFTIAPSQSDFVAPMAETLEANVGAWDDHVVVREGAPRKVVGFFQIDARGVGPRIPGQIEIHEVRIDRVAQGQGYGKAFFSVLPDYLRAQYPEATDVCLTVNCRNPRAYHVYSSAGFVNTGELYLHGGAGPQHIMTLNLRPGTHEACDDD